MLQKKIIQITDKIPEITQGTLSFAISRHNLILRCFLIGTVYTYLANGVGRRDAQGAFRALSRGFSHWASGRVDRIEVNINHPEMHYDTFNETRKLSSLLVN